MATMLLAFAEFEHDQITERLNTAKAVKKAHGGKTDGRYRISLSDFPEFLQKQKDGTMTVEECCAELGISRATWYVRARESA